MPTIEHAGRARFIEKIRKILLEEQDELLERLHAAMQKQDEQEKERIKAMLVDNQKEMERISRPFRGVIIEIIDSFDYYE